MTNKYKVPNKQWKRWSDAAKTVFNEVYYAMTGNNQRLFQHPATTAVPPKQWETTAFNAAWIAADATQAQLK